MTSIFNKVLIKDLVKLRTVVKTQHMKDYPESHINDFEADKICLLYTSPSPRDRTRSRMPSSA